MRGKARNGLIGFVLPNHYLISRTRRLRFAKGIDPLRGFVLPKVTSWRLFPYFSEANL
jgi:hypothetical protein